MGANVFANTREISGKAAGNKTIAKMPDVCLSPPSPPAGPIPIPYPNFAMASDTTGGSKKVKIGNKEVGLKGKSKYKKSKGDEAATRSFGASVVSHTITGSVKHAAGSFDVKIEGSNVVRFLDFTTGNGSNPSLPPGPDVGKLKLGKPDDPECVQLDNRNKEARKSDIDYKKMKKKGKKGWALATANYKPKKGRRVQKKATSLNRNVYVRKNKRNGYEKSVKAKNRPRCAGRGGYDAMRKNDAENKILDPIMRKGGGGTITMKIYHKATDGTTDEMPCPQCKKAICGAEKCGISVVLCNNKNQKVKANQLCENGKPKPVAPRGATRSQKEKLAKQRDELWRAAGFG